MVNFTKTDNLKAKKEGIIRKLFFRFIRWFAKFYVEFCDNSNIDGIRYFTKRKLHWTERFWWMFSMSVSFYYCVHFVTKSWEQWNDNPTSLSYSERGVSIAQIPFPTVTFCAEIKSLKAEFDLTAQVAATMAIRSNANLSKTEMSRLNLIAQVCPYVPDLLKIENRTDFDDFISDSVYDTFVNMAQPYNVTLKKCRWMGRKANCTDHVQPVITDQGLCYTFNALNSDEIYTDVVDPDLFIVKGNPNLTNWDADIGYISGSVDEEYPYRVVDSGRESSLDIALEVHERDFEYQCRGIDQGFNIILTTPGDVMKMSRNTYRLPLLEDAIIMVSARTVVNTRGIGKLRPNSRGCYYAGERTLRFYRNYTQSNCREECSSNWMKKECGCVKFTMPRERNTKVCGPAKIECYKMAERNLLTSYRARKFRDKCNCLQRCKSLDYGGNIDRIESDMLVVHKAEDDVEEKVKGIHATRLAVFFRNNQVETIKRMEVTSYSDFLAIIGSLLGLFLGVSTLSVLELIYYASLRWYWEQKRAERALAEKAAAKANGSHISVIPVKSVD